MQEGRLQQARLGPEVEADFGLQVLGLETRLPLPQRQIAGERHLRHAFVDLAHGLADIEPPLDHLQRHVVAMTERGQRRLAHFGEPRHGEIAQSGQRERQPSRLDGRSRGRRMSLGPHERGRPRLPMGGEGRRVRYAAARMPGP
jgi:hypothetical protein